MSLPLPHSFGRYWLTHLIGEGGMAEVYQASVRVAEGLEKKVVIKKIRKEFADQYEFTRMFVEEAKIALSLNHANIVQVFDFGQVRGDFYLAMEAVEGVDLMRLMHAVRDAGHRVPPVIAAYLGHQVAAGLAYAHRKADDYGRPLGIVHRDVSPHNVMVSYEGQVKILDFGIARTRARTAEQIEAAALSTEETIKGKIAYMSPEQARGRPLDQRSDVYSLGICLYEVLTGTLMFRERNRLKALQQVRTTPVPPLTEVAPEVPAPLSAIVAKALARELPDRYESARALQADLAEFLHRSDPVVDDEVLASFVGHYFRPDPPTGVGPRLAIPERGSRDPDTQHTQYPVRASRETQRVVIVWVAIEAPAKEPPAEPRAFLALAHDVAFKREGLVLRAEPSALVLAFGALLRTGGDAERALRAALALRDDAVDAAPGLRLGFLVASAPAVVERDDKGSVRVRLRGPVAKQLAAAAGRSLEGPVMVSANLVDTLSEAWRFGEPPLSGPDAEEGSGSGTADPELLPLTPLLGPAAKAERRPLGPPGGRALVGRELELKTLRDAFSDAIRSRRSRSVLITGEPGLGKRALVERFVASLPRTAAWVLRATGSWSRRNAPMGVFLDLLARFLEVEHHTPSAAIVERLSRLGIKEAELLGQTLATSLGLADAEPPGLSPRTRRDRLWRLVRRLVIGLAQRRPVLIIVENLQFHDEQSLDLLREWIHAEPPFPVLGLATGRAGNRRVELVRSDPAVTEIHLEELDPRARRDLIERRFEDPEAAAPLVDAILARTGGNPLFIEQTLASLVERGVVAWNAQGRQLVVRQRAATVELPRSIEAALGERIEELAPSDREVLQGAAVLGRHFRADELPRLLDREVDDALAHLVDRGFVERIEGARPGAESHRFATVSLHETCKSSLAHAQAERLHGRAAELRRAREDYSPERDAGPIAEHLMAAGRSAEAIEPALQAAEGASEVAGNVEAYYYFSLALRALPQADPRRFDVLLRRERILRAWGQRRAQVADIRELLAHAEREGDPKLLAIASVRLLRFYLEVGRTQPAERLLPRVDERVSAVAQPAPFRAVVAELRSELAFQQGRFSDAEQAAREGLEHCGQDTRGLRQRARLLRAVGQVASGIGRYEEAREAYEEALSLARRIDNVRLEANLLNALGEVAGRSTHYQEAHDYFKASLAIDRELGDRFTTGRKLANLGLIYAAVGLHARAERYLRKALELHEAVGHPGEWGDVVVALGEVVASLGDLEAARSLLEDAAEMARRREDVRTELRARIRLAAVLLDQGRDSDRPTASTIAEQVLESARSHGLRTARRRALAVLARIAQDEDHPEEAIEHEREAVMLVRAGADPIDGVRSIHHLGRLLVARGDPEGPSLLREAAAMLQRRLDDLRDEDLRRGYLDQPDARRILVDGGLGGPDTTPEADA
ncbi:MAG: protein kinase [Myxococcales bacterium]|nr:protein kinase [Myxococcales bacterium]MCB9712526.1 protein kinase [Myxococcales bacterium]